MGLTQSTPEQPKQNSSWFGSSTPAAPATATAPSAFGGSRKRKSSMKKMKGGKRKSGKNHK
jgi:hypothetical protein